MISPFTKKIMHHKKYTSLEISITFLVSKSPAQLLTVLHILVSMVLIKVTIIKTLKKKLKLAFNIISDYFIYIFLLTLALLEKCINKKIFFFASMVKKGSQPLP